MSFLNRGGPISNLSANMIGLLALMGVVMLLSMMETGGYRTAYGAFSTFSLQWGLLPPELISVFRPILGDQLGWPMTGWITHIFVHASWWHLFGNAIAMASFGRQVENMLGGTQFLTLFFASALAGAAAQYFLSTGSPAPMVGASGAVSGLIGFAYFFTPRSARLMLFFVIPLPMRLGIALAVIFHIVMIVMGVGGVAWLAHLGGLIAGGVLGVLMFSPARAPSIWRSGFNWRNLW